MLIVVVMTMVVAMVMMARNSHHAFCAADNATGHSTDYAPDCRANRTGRVDHVFRQAAPGSVLPVP